MCAPGTRSPAPHFFPLPQPSGAPGPTQTCCAQNPTGPRAGAFSVPPSGPTLSGAALPPHLPTGKVPPPGTFYPKGCASLMWGAGVHCQVHELKNCSGMFIHFPRKQLPKLPGRWENHVKATLTL